MEYQLFTATAARTVCGSEQRVNCTSAFSLLHCVVIRRQELAIPSVEVELYQFTQFAVVKYSGS